MLATTIVKRLEEVTPNLLMFGRELFVTGYKEIGLPRDVEVSHTRETLEIIFFDGEMNAFQLVKNYGRKISQLPHFYFNIISKNSPRYTGPFELHRI